MATRVVGSRAAYNLFAPIYDRYWQRFSVLPMDVFERLALRELPPGARVLDLCCGTGQLARALGERGYRVIGVDSSERMLDFARVNAASATFIHVDARDLTLAEPVDAVFSTSDSLNHITTIADFANVVGRVQRVLHPGGLFVFDLNTEAKYRVTWAGTFSIVDDDLACTVSATYDEVTRLARFDGAVSLAGGEWRELVMEERCHSRAEVEATLRDAGFRDTTIYDWQRDLDPAGETEKLYIVCRA